MIRPANQADDDPIWNIFHAVVASGDTYVYDPPSAREQALGYWLRSETHTYVAEREGQVVATYILKPNQPALGSHVANAGFMVSPMARGLGVGRRMAEHCLAEARRFGFRAMQFNLVVSTNEAAVKLWQQLGFRIIGTVPEAFRHSKQGFVDAYVMYQSLQ